MGARPALPSIKKLRLNSPERKGGSIVPETPEKKEREREGEEEEEGEREQHTPRSGALCNIQSLLCRLDPGAKITNFQVHKLTEQVWQSAINSEYPLNRAPLSNFAHV